MCSQELGDSALKPDIKADERSAVLRSPALL